jgi:hypothetical protein
MEEVSRAVMDFKETTDFIKGFYFNIADSLDEDVEESRIENNISKKTSNFLVENAQEIRTNSEYLRNRENIFEDIYVGRENKVHVNFEEEKIENRGEDPDDITKHTNNVVSLYRGREALLKAALVDLASSIEDFFRDVMSIRFEKRPQALSSDEEVFSLNDINAFESISEAKSRFKETKVRNVLRESFGEWVEYTKNDIGLDMEYMSHKMGEIIELFQRRNIFIHNRGFVNSQYSTKVSENYSENTNLGERLKIDKKYISDKVNISLGMVTLIGLELWEHLGGDNSQRLKFADSMLDVYAKNKNFYITRDIGMFLWKDEAATAGYTDIGKLNYWMSQKRLGNWDSVEEEILDEDYSAKRPRIRLPYLSLCENEDKFAELLPKALKSEEITEEEIYSYPIFMEMRGVDRIEGILEEDNE